jgi:ribosome biogenesis protein BRX1
MHFAWQDGHIWVRNYQLLPLASASETELRGAVPGVSPLEGMTVVEIGPRFVLCPIRILEGSFWGRTLWQNQEYVSPAVARAAIRLESAIKSRKRNADAEMSSLRKSQNVLPRDDLEDVFA